MIGSFGTRRRTGRSAVCYSSLCAARRHARQLAAAGRGGVGGDALSDGVRAAARLPRDRGAGVHGLRAVPVGRERLLVIEFRQKKTKKRLFIKKKERNVSSAFR